MLFNKWNTNNCFLNYVLKKRTSMLRWKFFSFDQFCNFWPCFYMLMFRFVLGVYSSIRQEKSMWNVSSNWLVYFPVAPFVWTAFLWHSESSATVTLLVDADWMMLTNASNQGEANSMTIAPLAHKILTANASRFESCISQKLFGG